MKRKLITFTCLLISLLQLSACGTRSTEVNQASKDSQAKADVLPLGTRENPLNLNQLYTYQSKYEDITGKKGKGSFSIIITDVVRGKAAYESLKSSSEYNQEPPKKKEWVILTVAFTMQSGSTKDPYFLVPSFDLLDNGGYKIEQEQQAILAENEALGFCNVSPGKELHGKVVFLAQKKEPLYIKYEANNAKAFFLIE